MSEAWGVERGALWALDLPAPGPAPDVPPGIRFGEVDIDGAAALAAAMSVAEQEVVSRWRLGCRVIGAWHGEEVAAYCWLSTRRQWVGELARDLVLPPGDSYVWDCATVPRFRGRGLYTSLLRTIVRMLAAEGQRRVWIGASSTNRASNRAFGSAGFTPAVSAIALRLAGRGVLLRIWGAADADSELVGAGRRLLTGRR
jgi:ribosomal protein S18 acetylase RimI-like enzyme